MRLRRLGVVGFAVAAIVLLLASSPLRSALAQQGAQLHTKMVGVSAETLVVTDPDDVPDPTLALIRVMVAPGASIPVHRHTGTQIATIISGELTYSVRTGQVDLYLAGTTPSADTPVVLGPDDTVVLRSGDAIVEHTGSLHQATNAGAVPVLLFSSILFPGAEKATVYEEIEGMGTPVSAATPAA